MDIFLQSIIYVKSLVTKHIFVQIMLSFFVLFNNFKKETTKQKTLRKPSLFKKKDLLELNFFKEPHHRFN